MNMELRHKYTVGQNAPSRSKILDLQAALMAQPDAMTEEEMENELNEHFFAPGVYGRKMTIKAGMCIVGKIHKHAHLNVITKGVIKVVTEFSEDVYTGPKIWVSEPGIKRAVYAIEDTEWLTIHHNASDETDIREIEREVIASSYQEFDGLLPGGEA